MTDTPSPDLSQPPSASQTLEDLACAYWLSDVLFAALELRLFGFLAFGPLAVSELARVANCLAGPLSRLLATLSQLGLVDEDEGRWQNLPLAARHLVPDTPAYLGDFLLYRRYLQTSWHGLASTVAGRALPPALSPRDDYPTRNLHYVRALDQLARLKAVEIVQALSALPWRGPILDIGGGAGALCRELVKQQATSATLLELPEIIKAAHLLYPDPDAWRGITARAGDFRDHDFADHERFGVILLANFLHTYDEAAARQCLHQAVALLAPGGHLIIHDYCPDRQPVKGQLYDLNMMLNTHQGHCFPALVLGQWLTDCGLLPSQVIDLPSDSSLVLAQAPGGKTSSRNAAAKS